MMLPIKLSYLRQIRNTFRSGKGVLGVPNLVSISGSTESDKKTDQSVHLERIDRLLDAQTFIPTETLALCGSFGREVFGRMSSFINSLQMLDNVRPDIFC